MNLSKYYYWAPVLLFPLFMIDYFLIMLGINLNTFIILPLYGVIGLFSLKVIVTDNGSLTKMLNIWIVYNILSIILYAINDTPGQCYISALKGFIYPIALAYVGYKRADNNVDKWFILSCLFCFVIGLYLYFTMPDFYRDFLLESRNKRWYRTDVVDEDGYIDTVRFCSFFDSSYAISYFSIPAFVLSVGYCFNGKCDIAKPILYAVAILSFAAALLSQQRIAMAFVVFYLLFFIFGSPLYSDKPVNIRFVSVAVLVLIAVLIVPAIRESSWMRQAISAVSFRMESMSFSMAMEGRSNQYTDFDRSTWWSYLVGLGMGSCGGVARSYGLAGVSDGFFVKTFYENGLIGCIIFFVLLVSTLVRGIRSFRAYYKEVLILVFYIAAGIGADSFARFIFTSLAWYAIGRLWNNEYLDNRLKEL